MKVTIFNKTLPLLLLSIALTGCVNKSPVSHQKYFNTDEFVGFDSIDSGKNLVYMDYELDGSDGIPLVFKSCKDVKKTLETDVITSQYHLWRLIQLNCKAANMVNSAIASSVSYWAADYNPAFIENLPTTAIPNLGGNSLDSKTGSLKDSNPKLTIKQINDNSINATLSGDLDITYVLMGRGDFDHDGTEDILLRLDWNITTAFGKGFSLLLLSKPSVSNKAEIVWRDG